MEEKKIEFATVHFTEEEAEHIAGENLGLVHHIIGTLNITDFDYSDLYDAGIFGYAKAIKTFDKSKSTKFSTYACNCIRNEIVIHIKKERKHLVNDISLNKQVAMNNNNRELIVEDIVEDKNCKLGKVEDTMMADETRRRISRAINRLDIDEQLVIKYRFGLFGCDELYQRDIAKILNMSQANVSKLEKIGLKKLKFYIALER